jgi:hypothetical protein
VDWICLAAVEARLPSCMFFRMIFDGASSSSSLCWCDSRRAQSLSVSILTHGHLQPRESRSKEADASLLTIVGFPAFAVDDPNLASLTRSRIQRKLLGKYGCRRFLLDGYQTAVEDKSRLHYETAELQVSAAHNSPWLVTLQLMHPVTRRCSRTLNASGLSSLPFWRWTVFSATIKSRLCGTILQEMTCERLHARQAEMYLGHLRSVMVPDPCGSAFQTVPELYMVPRECLDAERARPHSQASRFCSPCARGVLTASDADAGLQRDQEHAVGPVAVLYCGTPR